MRGAVAKGLEGDGRAQIKNRKCRRNYGTDCQRTFVHGVHRESDSFISSFTGVKSAGNQMRWLVTKGQSLSTSTTAHTKVPFRQYFWAGDYKEASLDLLASDTDIPGSRKDQVRIANIEDIGDAC